MFWQKQIKTSGAILVPNFCKYIINIINISLYLAIFIIWLRYLPSNGTHVVNCSRAGAMLSRLRWCWWSGTPRICMSGLAIVNSHVYRFQSCWKMTSDPFFAVQQCLMHVERKRLSHLVAPDAEKIGGHKAAATVVQKYSSPKLIVLVYPRMPWCNNPDVRWLFGMVGGTWMDVPWPNSSGKPQVKTSYSKHTHSRGSCPKF